MCVNPAVLHRFQPRVPLLAALVAAMLALSGCASKSALTQTAPVSTVDEAMAADAQRAAAIANSGAQTTKVTNLQKFLWVFSPYRPDIQQGNFVSKEMLEQLKVGQTRDQVKFLLGTPLLTDLFHADRWDYPFTLARGNGELTASRVSIYFKDGKVEKFDGGNLPTEKEYIARIAGPNRAPEQVKKKEEVGSASISTSK
jgi:outer membrane protein assembly factor BamE